MIVRDRTGRICRRFPAKEGCLWPGGALGGRGRHGTAAAAPSQTTASLTSRWPDEPARSCASSRAVLFSRPDIPRSPTGHEHPRPSPRQSCRLPARLPKIIVALVAYPAASEPSSLATLHASTSKERKGMNYPPMAGLGHGRNHGLRTPSVDGTTTAKLGQNRGLLGRWTPPVTPVRQNMPLSFQANGIPWEKSWCGFRVTHKNSI